MIEVFSIFVSAIVVLLGIFLRQAYASVSAQQIAAVNVRAYLFQMSQSFSFLTTGGMARSLEQLRDSPIGDLLILFESARNAYERNESCSQIFAKIAHLLDRIRTDCLSSHESQRTFSIIVEHMRALYFDMKEQQFAVCLNSAITTIHDMSSDITKPFGREAASLPIDISTKLAYMRNIQISISLHIVQVLLKIRHNNGDEDAQTFVEAEILELIRQHGLQLSTAAKLWSVADDFAKASTAKLAYRELYQFLRGILGGGDINRMQ